MSSNGGANAAIHFQPDGYDTGGPTLMGRQAAGNGFLRGFFRHAGVETLYCHAPAEADARSFAALAVAEEVSVPVRRIAPGSPAALAIPGCLYLPGPGLGPLAFERLRVGERNWSLCGVTHTTASHTAMDAITGLLTTPVRTLRRFRISSAVSAVWVSSAIVYPLFSRLSSRSRLMVRIRATSLRAFRTILTLSCGLLRRSLRK